MTPQLLGHSDGRMWTASEQSNDRRFGLHCPVCSSYHTAEMQPRDTDLPAGLRKCIGCNYIGKLPAAPDAAKAGPAPVATPASSKPLVRVGWCRHLDLTVTLDGADFLCLTHACGARFALFVAKGGLAVVAKYAVADVFAAAQKGPGVLGLSQHFALWRSLPGHRIIRGPDTFSGQSFYKHARADPTLFLAAVLGERGKLLGYLPLKPSNDEARPPEGGWGWVPLPATPTAANDDTEIERAARFGARSYQARRGCDPTAALITSCMEGAHWEAFSTGFRRYCDGFQVSLHVGYPDYCILTLAFLGLHREARIIKRALAIVDATAARDRLTRQASSSGPASAAVMAVSEVMRDQLAQDIADQHLQTKDPAKHQTLVALALTAFEGPDAMNVYSMSDAIGHLVYNLTEVEAVERMHKTRHHECAAVVVRAREFVTARLKGMPEDVR